MSVNLVYPTGNTVREYGVTAVRRSHQGRKPGTVIPVRKLASAEFPMGDLRRFCVCCRASRTEALCSYTASQRHKHRGAARLRTFKGVEPMGRGRAKAKQVKVARQLKYNSGGTDLDRLRVELGVGSDQRHGDHDDPYAAYDDEDAADEDGGEEDDDEEDWSKS
jgi:Protein of unknown function (DUF3073)